MSTYTEFLTLMTTHLGTSVDTCFDLVRKAMAGDFYKTYCQVEFTEDNCHAMSSKFTEDPTLKTTRRIEIGTALNTTYTFVKGCWYTLQLKMKGQKKLSTIKNFEELMTLLSDREILTDGESQYDFNLLRKFIQSCIPIEAGNFLTMTNAETKETYTFDDYCKSGANGAIWLFLNKVPESLIPHTATIFDKVYTKILNASYYQTDYDVLIKDLVANPAELAKNSAINAFLNIYRHNIMLESYQVIDYEPFLSLNLWMTKIFKKYFADVPEIDNTIDSEGQKIFKLDFSITEEDVDQWLAKLVNSNQHNPVVQNNMGLMTMIAQQMKANGWM